MENDITHTGTYLLGQIDAKMTAMLASFAVQKADIKEEHIALNARIDAQHARVDRLERMHWKTAGVLSIIPVFFTFAGLVIAYINMN